MGNLTSSSAAFREIIAYGNRQADANVTRFAHVMYAEGAVARYERYKREGTPMRRDRQPDMRYASNRWIKKYENRKPGDVFF